MLQALTMAIAHSFVDFTNGLDAKQVYDQQLAKTNIVMCREASKFILQFMCPIRISKWCTWNGHASGIHTWI